MHNCYKNLSFFHPLSPKTTILSTRNHRKW